MRRDDDCYPEIRNEFLNLVNQTLRKSRPSLPEGFNERVFQLESNGKTFANVRFRSRGCQHDLRGGCSMCDYWAGRRLSANEMIDIGQKGLNQLDAKMDLLVFGPSGSFFDDWEVPREVRIEFYRRLSDIDANAIALFTRSEFVTEEKLDEVESYLHAKEVRIEVGLETADPFRLKYCLNKGNTPRQAARAAKLIKAAGYSSTSYVLSGTPFLTPKEAIEDTIDSVRWSFALNFDRCELFPVHIKPWTFLYWAHQKGLYPKQSLWSLVAALNSFNADDLRRISVRWYDERPDRDHPSYTASNIPADTCPNCRNRVIDLFDCYRFSEDRRSIVDELMSISCECKGSWGDDLSTSDDRTICERIETIYEGAANSILEEGWWTANRERVLQQIRNDHS